MSVLFYLLRAARVPRLALLTRRGVLKELQPTRAQIDAVKKQVPHLKAALGQAREKLRKVPEGERAAKVLEAVERLDAATSAQLAKLLDTRQMERFEQIERQLNVARAALHDADGPYALGLTAEQRHAIERVDAELFRELGELRDQAIAEEVESIPEKIIALFVAANDAAVALFTDAQREAWRRLTGEPFDLQKLSIRRN